MSDKEPTTTVDSGDAQQPETLKRVMGPEAFVSIPAGLSTVVPAGLTISSAVSATVFFSARLLILSSRGLAIPLAAAEAACISLTASAELLAVLLATRSAVPLATWRVVFIVIPTATRGLILAV